MGLAGSHRPVSRAVVPNHGMVESFVGKGCKDAGFLTVTGIIVWDSSGWEELSLLYKYRDSGKSQASGPKTLLASVSGVPGHCGTVTHLCLLDLGVPLLQAGPCCYSSAEALSHTYIPME